MFLILGLKGQMIDPNYYKQLLSIIHGVLLWLLASFSIFLSSEAQKMIPRLLQMLGKPCCENPYIKYNYNKFKVDFQIKIKTLEC